eukprot:TRINITY_DN6710_c0_g1_i1.p1 TRINITY_DN6710_c0_g1~~TRINITY_DN6710_c0_g1_i1.p1  ORF type:complete len:806 (+),score=232.20 TRINITY_DN6710_c0_g1_i1:59-2419(+)
MAAAAGLVPIRLPPELEQSFRGLEGVPLLFIDYVLKVNKRGKKQKRVAVVTESAFFVCDTDGGIARCVSLRDIAAVWHGGSDSKMGLGVPCEGADQRPSYDLLFRTGNTDFLLNVLRKILALRRSEAGLPATQFHEAPLDQPFPDSRMNLVRPEGWSMRLDHEILDCVTDRSPAGAVAAAPQQQPRPLPSSSAQGWSSDARPASAPSWGPAEGWGAPQLGPPAEGWGGPQLGPPADGWRGPTLSSSDWSPGSGTESVAQALQHAAEATRGSLQEKQLGQVLEKLRTMEREVRRLRKEKRRPDAAPAGLPPPAAIWGDLLNAPPAPPPPPPPPAGAVPCPQGAVPAVVDGVGGYLVPRGQAASAGPEIDDELPSTQGLAATGVSLHAPPAADPALRCWHCGADLSREPKLPRCGGCREALYCGRACQTAHWTVHRRDCAGYGGSESSGTPSRSPSQSPSGSPDTDECATPPRRASKPAVRRGDETKVWEHDAGPAHVPVQPQIVIVHHQSAPQPPPAAPVYSPPPVAWGRRILTPTQGEPMPCGLGVAPRARPPATPPGSPRGGLSRASSAQPPCVARSHQSSDASLMRGVIDAAVRNAVASPQTSDCGNSAQGASMAPSQGRCAAAPRQARGVDARSPGAACAAPVDGSIQTAQPAVRSSGTQAAADVTAVHAQTSRADLPTAPAIRSPRRSLSPYLRVPPPPPPPPLPPPLQRRPVRKPVRQADAARDRVYDDTLPPVERASSPRPPPPPPPPQGGDLDYDKLFQSYRNYYTAMLLGQDKPGDEA